MLRHLSFAITLAALAPVSLANAQQLPAATQQTQTIKRTPLQKFDSGHKL